MIDYGRSDMSYMPNAMISGSKCSLSGAENKASIKLDI
jgi:hypothetical protein